jgi:ankyrin repeat protein
MRKVIVFLYFVFIFKLAFANSLPSINVFGDEELSKIEPASGMQVAQNQIPELPSMQDAASAPLPEDFNLPTLDSNQEEDELQAEKNTKQMPEEFESAPLPPTLATGAVPSAIPAEVADVPTLPEQPTTDVVATENANIDTQAENTSTENINIDQIISESSVREQFPETPDLNKTSNRNREEESKVIPITAEERAEEVDSLLNEVFDKDKTPEQLEAEKKEIEKDKKLKEELSNKEQLDLPIMEDVISVDEQNLQPLDSLAEMSDDSEQLPLDAMPDSMKDNYQPKITSSGKIISTSNTYSEQRLSELLVTAAMRGDKKSVIDLINSGRNPDSQNQFGETALMGAIYSGNNEIVEVLLAEGADVNLPDSKGNTPLIVASARNNVQAVQQLVKAGADIDIANNASDTPILVAALKNNNQVLDNLVREGGDINKPNAEGLTALHVAAFNDNVQLARYLLNLGANPNVLAKGGYKPYDLVRDKNSQTAQLLIAYANDIQRKMEAQKMAHQIKVKNTAPVAKNIYANADQYAVFPKAYSQPQERQASTNIPKSDWWAAKNVEQPVKADYSQTQETQLESQNIQNLEIQNASIETNNLAEVQKPASIAFREISSNRNIQNQATNISQNSMPVSNKVQNFTPLDNIQVQKLEVKTQVSEPATVNQPKVWRKLTVDQEALRKEAFAKQQNANIPQQNISNNLQNQNSAVSNSQPMVRAVYDDNGNLITQAVIQQNLPVAAINNQNSGNINLNNQPASLAINQNQQVSGSVTSPSVPVNSQMQIQRVSQTQQQTQFQPVQITSYNELDESRKQAWDFRLQQWVKEGMFLNNKNEAQKASWLNQQRVFQTIYQDQFNIKVDAIKKQLTGGASANAKPSANNNYGQQNMPQQDAFLSSYAAVQTPFSQTF